MPDININIHRASMTAAYENSKPYIEGACKTGVTLPTAEDYAIGSLMSVIDTTARTVTVNINTGDDWMPFTTFEA